MVVTNSRAYGLLNDNVVSSAHRSTMDYLQRVKTDCPMIGYTASFGMWLWQLMKHDDHKCYRFVTVLLTNEVTSRPCVGLLGSTADKWRYLLSFFHSFLSLTKPSTCDPAQRKISGYISISGWWFCFIKELMVIQIHNYYAILFILF